MAMSNPPLIFFILLLLLTLAIAEGNPDELNNSKKQSPCCVAQQLLAPCQGSISGDCGVPLQTSQIKLGSICACNTVVYNLWAACVQARGNQSLSFSDWTMSCSGNGSTITYKDYPLHDDTSEIDIPSWAYLNITQEDTFDIFGALNLVRKWTPIQIVAPILVGLGVCTFFTIGLLVYRRSKSHKKFGSGRGSINFSWRGTLNGSRSIFGTVPSIVNIRPYREPYDQSWAIDDLDARTLQQTSDFDLRGEHEWFAFSPITPSSPKSTTQRIQAYLKRSRGFWKNPFKGRPVQVLSTQARKGFRVDDSDLSTRFASSRRPTLDTLHSPIFDNRDEELDENSVLLISKPPGVDFRSNASHDGHSSEVNVHVDPPSRPISYDYALPTSHSQSSSSSTAAPSQFSQPPPHSTTSGPTSSQHTLENYRPHLYNPSVESILRPAKTDPTMLFPASVRAAGYTGVPGPGIHGRTVSAESMLSTNTPMTLQ